MWHEARRREKATQKLLNEHKKRAEKRREENRIDPISSIQVHGIKSKLLIDANTYKQAEKSLVVWQGDKNVTIDRFDVRATLNSIPTDAEAIVARKRCKSGLPDELKRTTILDIDESDSMKKLLNYERYRLLMQNDLNQVPEHTRLKLVVKSEYLTDAHLKKLQNNRFGTSGESNYATTSQSSLLSNNKISGGSSRLLSNSRDQQAARKGSTGPNCNQVPPPASLQSTAVINNDDVDDNQDDKRQQTIVDLEEYENFDLDNIDEQSLNTKRANEITSKYGLSSDEFGLLARRDQTELQTLEMIRELKKLVESNQKKDQSSAESAHPNPVGIYGPSLPPEMMLAATNKTKSPESNCSGGGGSSAGGSPVRQRSPSGANIPFRNGKTTATSYRSPVSSREERFAAIDDHHHRLDHNQSVSKTTIASGTTPPPSSTRSDRHSRTSLNSHALPAVSSRYLNSTDQSSSSHHHHHRHGSSSNNHQLLLSRSSRDRTPGRGDAVASQHHHYREPLLPRTLTGPRAKSPPPISPEHNSSRQQRSRSRSGDRDADSRARRGEESARSRKRAETPLAYKRHCRTSRSLSRERYLGSRHHHHLQLSDHRSSSTKRPADSNWRSGTGDVHHRRHDDGHRYAPMSPVGHYHRHEQQQRHHSHQQQSHHHDHYASESRRHRSYSRSPTRSRSRSRSGSYSGASSQSSYSSHASIRFTKTRSRSASYSSFYSNKSSIDHRPRKLSSSSAYMADRRPRGQRGNQTAAGNQQPHQPPRRRPKKRRTGKKRKRRGGRRRRR